MLFVEDSDDDVVLELAALREGGFEPVHEVVDGPDELRAALARGRWELVLADYVLPLFSGLDALRIVRASDPDLPFILISGAVGEDLAVGAMRAGANDYVLKGNLARLAASVERELREAEVRRDKERIEQEHKFLADVHSFLAGAGKVLGRTLDIDSTLREAARLAVTRLADHAVGYREEDGRVRAVVQVHAGAGAFEDLAGSSEEGEAHPARAVLRGGPSILIPEVTDDVLEHLGGGEGGRDALRSWGIRSAMLVPLRGRADVVGALLLASSSPDRRYAERDLLVAEDFAGRAGLAVDNARLYRQAQDAIRVRDEFLAMLGHELRNPLAPILTALELMRLRGEGRTSREHAVIERQALHLVRLVDDLLDVSRLAQGKVTLRCAPIELAVVIAKAIETASPLIEQRQHHLFVDVSSTGLPVLADEARLSQVVSNLLTNAAKYTEPGGQIRIRAAREGAQLILSVSDTGVGIHPELLPSVFDLFVQGKRTIDRQEGGLGLGLALARNLTKLHGGTIEVRSEGPGRGSEFVVRLPALDESWATATPAPPPRPSGPGAGSLPRVLVVDDNADAAALLSDALASQGYVVRVATDPLQALAFLESFRADVAVLDLGLPVMDGYELGARLRQQYGASLRLVAVTGYGQEADKARARAAGFDAHLVKPVDLRLLTKVLRA